MTEIPSYVIENPNFEPCKPKKQHNLYSSLLPILLSIFTYVFIFHVLEASPFSIFNDTKILFLISNALILIIAADYGAFTDKENQDFYKEYTTAMRRDTRESNRPENSVYEANLPEEIKKRGKQEIMVANNIKPRYLLHKEAGVSEKTEHVVNGNQPRNIAIEKYKPKIMQNIHKIDVKEETCNARNLANPKTYGRSKSDKARSERNLRKEIKNRPKCYDRSKSDSMKWMVVHKEKKKKKALEEDEKWENVREESEEFSKMSNEELNRRVEDFIQRFNKDIKRQKAMSSLKQI
ncbi:unnamed protein product [Cochlearia groenlandica]